MPIVRTFTPVVAGVSKMKYRTYLTYDLLGGLLWGVGVTMLGYFLGQVDFVEKNLEVAILAVVAISLMPMAFELWKARRESKAGGHAADVVDEVDGTHALVVAPAELD